MRYLAKHGKAGHFGKENFSHPRGAALNHMSCSKSAITSLWRDFLSNLAKNSTMMLLRTAALKCRLFVIASKPLNAEIVNGNASPATAGAGVSRSLESVVVYVVFSRQKGKPDRRKFQGELMFGRYSSYCRAAANEGVYG